MVAQESQSFSWKKMKFNQMQCDSMQTKFFKFLPFLIKKKFKRNVIDYFPICSQIHCFFSRMKKRKFLKEVFTI